jgi:hypothetical protein
MRCRTSTNTHPGQIRGAGAVRRVDIFCQLCCRVYSQFVDFYLPPFVSPPSGCYQSQFNQHVYLDHATKDERSAAFCFPSVFIHTFFDEIGHGWVGGRLCRREDEREGTPPSLLVAE